MRIWDINLGLLCRRHLLAEHLELHVIWSVITNQHKGYSRHPETLRWRGRLRALYYRHEQQVAEMERRNYVHASPLDYSLATGAEVQTQFINTPDEQTTILKSKNCSCFKEENAHVC